ncbi:MAG: FHA domain-containing protein [Eubacterium sp.]|nr:FHA domain-containing protein [Oscillospiraceae bacterium]MDD6355225.1 FHA domain-containing protein [Oscillospiraceae bacterium]MDY4608305.1 FHA domain-containing protein [Eubacterium sp.]
MMNFVIGIMRFVAPAAAVFILATCIISLFRNRPRIHRLAQLVDQNDGSVIDINHWETSIGKSKANDIVLPFPAVARFHAVIAKKRVDWVVTDTSARTIGITVNGEKIDGKRVIENGDIITIGNIPLKFVCEEALTSQSKQQIRQSVPVSKNVAYGVLVDVSNHHPVYLKKKDVLIGRGQDADIQIMSQMVSSHHARIYQTSKGWALADLDSHNGTKLNGRYITQPQLIFDEDIITFGDKVFVFYEK